MHHIPKFPCIIFFPLVTLSLMMQKLTFREETSEYGTVYILHANYTE